METTPARESGSDDSQDSAGRRLYWWNMPVRRERNVEAGNKMLASVGLWFVSLVGLIVVLAVIFG